VPASRFLDVDDEDGMELALAIQIVHAKVRSGLIR